MEFKVSVYPLNFFLVNKTFKTNNTSFRGEKNESITNTIRKSKRVGAPKIMMVLQIFVYFFSQKGVKSCCFKP